MLETRSARRFDCDEPVDLEIRGRLLMANLKDISLGGARLFGHDLPEVGSLIRLAPAFGEGLRQWVYAQVCWIRRGETEEAGLRFLEPRIRLQGSWVSQLCQGDPERRSSIRVATEVHLEMKVAGVRRPLEATSLDLSYGGTQVLLPGVLRAGSRADVTLCLPWGVVDLPAQVVRLDGFLRAELQRQHQPQQDSTILLELFNRRRN